MGDVLPDPSSTKTHSWKLLGFFPNALFLAHCKAEVQPQHIGQANTPLRAMPRLLQPCWNALWQLG